MKLTRAQLLVLLGIVTVVIALLTNIATNQLPERWTPSLLVCGLLLILLIALFAYLTYKTSKEPDPPPPPELDETSYYQALSKRYKT
ncbi:MAG TPA: hypothetical protein VFS77_18300, partial [Pyrinomonadaceae bacterium]|nr:hypothetical protein [Pyrinomonadaceae bacterium]